MCDRCVGYIDKVKGGDWRKTLESCRLGYCGAAWGAEEAGGGERGDGRCVSSMATGSVSGVACSSSKSRVGVSSRTNQQR